MSKRIQHSGERVLGFFFDRGGLASWKGNAARATKHLLQKLGHAWTQPLAPMLMTGRYKKAA